MSMKLKALSLGLIAMIAMSAFVAINATAKTGGHFVSDEAHTLIVGNETLGTEHRLEFTTEGIEGGIVCDEASYSGTAAEKTVTSLSITPKYGKCHTTPESPGTTVVDVNGCTFTFTVASGEPVNTENTVDLLCPAGNTIEITHPNCTITVGPQNNLESVTYTTTEEGGKHTITLDANVSFVTQYHAGICIFLGTSHKGALKGSATVKGTNTAGGLIGITST